MTIDLTILEHQFFDPCWEPSDCSVLETRSGRLQVFCHYSQRIIAWVDTHDEGRVLIDRARIGASLRHLKSLAADDPSRDFFQDRYAPVLRFRRESIASRGFPASEGGAPEIEGADARNAARPEAAFIRECLAGGREAVIAIAADSGLALPAKRDGGMEIDAVALRRFLGRYVSEHSDLDPARASIPLEGGEHAEVEYRGDGGTHSLAVARKPPFRPQYPHEL